jgi:hypothetical protein
MKRIEKLVQTALGVLALCFGANAMADAPKEAGTVDTPKAGQSDETKPKVRHYGKDAPKPKPENTDPKERKDEPKAPTSGGGW